MNAKNVTVWVITLLVVMWRLITWWSFVDLGEAYFQTKIFGLMGLIILMIGLIVYYPSKSRLSFIFFFYCAAMAFHWGGHPTFSVEAYSLVFTAAYSLLSIFMGSTLLHISLIYPDKPDISTGKLLAAYIPGIIGLVLFVASLINQNMIEIFNVVEPLLVTLFGLIATILFFRTFFKTQANERSSIGVDLICLGLLLANFPYIFSEFISSMSFGDGFSDLFYRLLIVIEPITIAIAIRRAENFLKTS